MSAVAHQAAYYILPLLSVIGFGGTVGLARSNGLFKSILKSLRTRGVTLPNSQAPLIRKWTYIRPIDNFLAFIITFFWPLSDGKNKTVKLQAQHFMGQLIAIWLVMELEGARTSGLSSYLIPAGMAVQIAGAATALPIWTALHLLTASRTADTSVLATEQNITAIPYAVALGLMVPLVGMTSTRAPAHKQFWIIMFQIFPIFTWTAGKLLAGQAGALSSTDGVNRVYNVAITVSTIAHLSSFGPSILSTIAPGLFDKGEARLGGPLQTFVPRFGLQNANDMVEARLNFMRWDEVITVGAFVVWAIVRTIPAGQGISAITTESVLRFLVQSLVLGPAGAAALVLKQNE